MFSFNGWQPGQWKLRRFFQVYTWIRKKAWNPSCSKIISSAKSKGPKPPRFSSVPKVPWVQISGLTLGQPTNQPLRRHFSPPPNSGSEARILVILDLADSRRSSPKSRADGMVDGFVVFGVTGDRPFSRNTAGWLAYEAGLLLEPEKPRKRWIYLQDHGGVV